MTNTPTLKCPVCASPASYEFESPIQESIFLCSSKRCNHRFLQDHLNTSGLRDTEDDQDRERNQQQRIETYGARNKKLFQYIKDNIEDQDGYIVDFGSGDGCALHQLTEIFEPSQLIAIEAEKDFHNFIKGNGFNVVNQIADIPDNSVRLFIMNEVIEHLPDPESILKEMHKKLQDNGCIFIATPLGQDIFERRVDYTFLVRGHLHFFTQESLNTTLQASGFHPIKRANVSMPLYSNAPETQTGIARIKANIAKALKEKLASRSEIYPLQHISGLVFKRS